MLKYLFSSFFFVLAMVANSPLLLAQEDISPENNRDRFVQPSPTFTPTAPQAIPQVTPEASPPQPFEVDNSEIFKLTSIKVTGSTVFTQEDFEPIVAPLREKGTVTLNQLIAASDAITQLYLNDGYITSRAAIVEESLATGAIQLLAIEGEIEDIIIEGNRSVNATYIRDRVALGIANPLNSADLEDQLRLLRSNPLFNNVEANLKAGSGLGQSILRVKVDEAKIVSGNVSVDSYSPPSIGSERMEVSVINRNLTGSGDSLSALYQRTTAGVPINLTLPIIIRSMLRGATCN